MLLHGGEMNYLGFSIFYAMSLIYIWFFKNSYTKRDWLFFGLKLILIYGFMFLFGGIVHLIVRYFPDVSLYTMKQYWIAFSMSLLCVWGTKFLVVGMSQIFSNIMSFHQNYNARNYGRIQKISEKYGTDLQFLAKLMASFGGSLMFYGIWLSGEIKL